jgi:hypothetical protein
MLFGTFDFHTRETPPSSEELAIACKPYIEAFGPERGMLRKQFPARRGQLELCGGMERVQAPRG